MIKTSDTALWFCADKNIWDSCKHTGEKKFVYWSIKNSFEWGLVPCKKGLRDYQKEQVRIQESRNAQR